MGYRRWVYHKTEEPRIIDSEDYEQYELNGWADTPAKFVKVTDFGVDPDNQVMVQALGETIQGIDDRLNGELNLDEMAEPELKEYAMKHLDLGFHHRTKAPKMREMIRAKL